MSFTNYTEQQVLNALFRNQSFTPPSTVYLALFTTQPTETLDGTEVSGGNYSRQAVTFSAPTAGTDGYSEIANSASITFPIATQDWGSVSYAGIYDAQTGGNLINYSAFDQPKDITTNDQFIIDIGNLKIQLN